MTVLASDIRVGSIVSGTRVTKDGTASTSGMVVDADEETVTLLDDRKDYRSEPRISVYPPGSTRPYDVRQCRLATLPIADVASVHEPSRGKQAMHTYARGALLRAGMGNGLMSDADLALVHAALRVVEASGVRAP